MTRASEPSSRRTSVAATRFPAAALLAAILAAGLVAAPGCGGDEDSGKPARPVEPRDEAPAEAPGPAPAPLGPATPKRPVAPTGAPVPAPNPAEPSPQDPAPGAAPPAPAKPDEPPEDPSALPAKIAALYEVVVKRPPPPDLGAADVAKERAEAAKALIAWEKAIDDLAAAADRYVAAVSSPDARTLFQAGYGKAQKAGRQGRNDAVATRIAAVSLLERALAASKPDDDFRADAEHALGHVKLLLAAAGKASHEQACAHLREATLRLQGAGRADDAGRAAHLAIETLLKTGKEDAARAFAEAVGAATADFGNSTPSLRVLAQRTATGVGAKFPDLPDAADTEGRAVAWSAMRGRPFLVHFFQAGRTTGKLSQERDVELTLVPLHAELSPKGLRLVGVSMDLALTKEQADRIRANWDEWGVKEHVQDGSLDAVRAWASDEGMTWPWIWDGKWGANPISAALGGCGKSVQHAVLVDADGVIRWRGDAPFVGLPEAARKVCE